MSRKQNRNWIDNVVTDANRPSDIFVFDRDALAARKMRALRDFSSFDFLFRWAGAQIADRLLDVNRQFETALQIGTRGVIGAHPKIGHLTGMDITPAPFEAVQTYVRGSEEFLPFGDGSLDLVLSNLNLHNVNDLPGALLQIRRALKPDGLFIGCLFGGETLRQLRDCMTRAEISLRGGVSPRVFPFADKPQMADLMQRAGFTLPVVDSEIITVTYDHVFKLFHDLRGMAESNIIAARDKRYAGRDLFLHTAQLYAQNYSDADGRIEASFEVIFLIGWAAHESQQKPLRPGSAQHRLAEVLGSEEIKTGDNATP